jgi:tetratricopeptide (TPR) repeat protein
MKRLAARAAALLALALAISCAPKAPPATAVTAPRFPSYPYPAVPADLGVDRVLTNRHDSAWQALQRGDLRVAEREFRAAAEGRPGFYPAETGLGFALLARREFRDALAAFDRAVLKAPQYVPGLLGRGEALAAVGRTVEAVTTLEAALAADPNVPDLGARIDALRFKVVEDQIAAARRAREAGRGEEARAAYERAIGSSPQSGFLYRELAMVEQRLGQLDSALVHARRAAELDPYDARAHILAGEILEEQRDFEAATREYEAAAAIEPGEAINERIEHARARAALAALPPEYRAIPSEPAITRAQLAALVGVRLEALIQQARRRTTPVMTDTRGSWAAPWIAAVVRAGVMDVYPNHTFQPAAIVRRSDLALAVSRVLALIGAERPEALEEWKAGRPRFLDLPPAHLGYPAAALAVSAGVLPPLEGNSFQPSKTVPGAEAVSAIERLEALIDARGGRAMP